MIPLRRQGTSTALLRAPRSIVRHLHQRRRKVVCGIFCQVSSRYRAWVEGLEVEDNKQGSMLVIQLLGRRRTDWRILRELHGGRGTLD